MSVRILVIGGCGFVGNALVEAFTRDDNEVKIIDPKMGTSLNDIDQSVFDATFICVPTPMRGNGDIDISIVQEAVETCRNLPNIKLVVLKSTVLPNIVEDYALKDERFIYNPEFLTERNAVDDFIHAPFHIIGGNNNYYCEELYKLYRDHSRIQGLNPGKVLLTMPKEAAFIKYGINSFLATKVAWMNQFFEAVSWEGCSFDAVSQGMMMDARIGHTHMQVPGPDGRYGFGGACFPKDTNALAMLAPELTILSSAIKYNNLIRSQYELDDREKEQHVSYELV